MNAQDHYNRLSANTVVSANKALDYYDGDQLPHMENYLSNKYTGIDKWKDRKIVPKAVNLVKQIIDGSARVYQDQPQRILSIGGTINDEQSAKYESLLSYSGNDAFQKCDILSRFLGVSMILANYSKITGEIIYRPLHRGNCDVEYNQETEIIESMFNVSGVISPRGNTVYTHWTRDSIKDIEFDGNSMRVLSGQDNPYGIIPAVPRYDMMPPRAGFWPKPSWELLVGANEAYNMFLIRGDHGLSLQTFPTCITNAKIPHGTVIGPDAIIEIESNNDEIYFEYKTPVINMEQARAFINGFIEVAADAYSVNLKTDGNDAVNSGFQLLLMNSDVKELTKQRIKAARPTESKLLEVVKVISDVNNLGISKDAKLTVDFREPSEAADMKTEREQDRLDYAAGIITLESIIKKRNPDITPEELAEEIIKINGVKEVDYTDAIN